MGPNRTSLRFVVGTALLTATTAAAAGGCDKPNVNTPAPDDKPNINTPPDKAPETNPGEGPIVNTAAPPSDAKAEPQPIINTPAPEPAPQPIINTPAPTKEPPTVNIVTAPDTKKPKPADKPTKK